MQRLLADAKMGKVMFLALAFLLLFGIGNAKAQQSEIQKIDNTFQISPLRYDWVVDLNDERQGVVFVKNNATVPINIETEIQDFSVNQDLQNNTRFFVPNENHPLKAYDVINWINIDKEPFRLEPGEAKAVNFSAKIPMTTPTGGYYGVIFFTKKPIEEEISNAPVQLNVTTRLGILLTFGVKGKEPINEKGNLALFSPTKKVFIDNPVGFNTQLANTGNFPFKISGTVDIFKFGKHMATLDMVPHLLYPDRVRSIEDLNWDFSLLDIGKYEAKLNLTSEDGSVVIAGTTTFFVIPWKLVAMVFFSLLILWIIFSAGRMSGKNNSTNNDGKK